MKPYVALALPSRAKIRRDHAFGVAAHSSSGECGLLSIHSSSSLLNHTFNMLWVTAHNMRADGHPFTHIAFLHDDIEPELHWLDKAVKELDAAGADMLSAYAPIKTEDGVTSMATYQEDIWDFNRFTIRQLAKMPETFTQDDVDGNLILNTGCCVLRLRDPWLERPEDFAFESLDRVIRGADGKFKARVISEDWLFSDKIRRAGGKLAATRKIALAHEGTKDYRNDTVWGHWDRDVAYLKRHENDHEKDQVPERQHVSAERRLAVA